MVVATVFRIVVSNDSSKNAIAISQLICSSETVARQFSTRKSRPDVFFSERLNRNPSFFLLREADGDLVGRETMAALKPVSSDKLEIAESRQGVATGKLTLSLSGDGRVLTISAVNIAPNASPRPSVTVFKKQ
jgi:hypothetical protein